MEKKKRRFGAKWVKKDNLNVKADYRCSNAKLALWVQTRCFKQQKSTPLKIVVEVYRVFQFGNIYSGDRGSTVVKVLCYKSEGCWFDPSWCQCMFH